jgi:glycosyltransferase involved in cell wall biosynthesis
VRILHIVGGLNRGGAETWLVQMLHQIDRRKYHMDFLVHTEEPGAYDDEVKALGARVIPCLKPSNPFQYAYNFRRILRAYGPYDCVHSHVHQFSGYVLLLAALMRVPVRMVHSHLDTRTIDRQSPVARGLYVAWMDALLRRYATRGIAVSECAAKSLFSECWRSDPRWSISPLGIDLRPFQQPVDPDVVRAEFGLAADALVVGHVGRFQEQKNHRFLVEIAEKLCALEPKAVFLLVGDGPLRSEIEALVRASSLRNRFVFAGVRKDVPRLMMGAMDCFLLPSFYEGLALVLWEAQAAGLTCLATEGLPKEATAVDDGIHYRSLTDSPDAWAGDLRELARSHLRSSHDRAWMPSEISITSSVKRIETLYALSLIA